jgi:hypothetical protein
MEGVESVLDGGRQGEAVERVVGRLGSIEWEAGVLVARRVYASTQ